MSLNLKIITAQPGASNMRQLVWSDELARIAQTWADQCDCVFQENQVMEHEKKDKNPKVEDVDNF